MSTADGVARHERDHDLRHRADEFLQIEHVEPGHAVATNVARMTSHALVAAGAKRVFPVGVRTRAGEEHHAHGRIFAGVDERLIHLHDRLGAERVALLRPVDRYLGDAIRFLITDIRECFDLLPDGIHAATVAAGRDLSRAGPALKPKKQATFRRRGETAWSRPPPIQISPRS